MKTKILIGLTLSAILFVGCGEKPKEEQKIVEAVPTETVTPVGIDLQPATVEPVATISEANHFDAIATYSSKCAGCHGAQGEGKAIFPKIAGQSKVELTKKLNGYKDGSYGKDRKAMMTPNVQNLNSDELGQIAEVIAKF
jgi:cytochrome c